MDPEQKLAATIEVKVKIQQVKIDDTIINYVTAGAGAPLLLIHGINIGWGEWYPNITFLSKRFKVYAIDLPGSGRSTPIGSPAITIPEDYLAIVEKFILRLKLTDVSIIGHSFGGFIALRLGMKKALPIRKILVESPLGFSQKLPFIQKLLSFPLFVKFISNTAMKPTRKNMTDFLTGVMYNKSVQQEFVDYYFHSLVKHRVSHPLQFMASFIQKFRLRPEFLLCKDLHRVGFKTMMLVGENDPTMTVSEIESCSKSLRNLKVIRFKHTGHVPSIERFEDFNKLAVNFLTT